jgi:hypothetical protein
VNRLYDIGSFATDPQPEPGWTDVGCYPDSVKVTASRQNDVMGHNRTREGRLDRRAAQRTFGWLNCASRPASERKVTEGASECGAKYFSR